MERNRKLQFIGLFVILSLLTCFIMPHGDDLLYLNYFNNNWNINRYNWVNNCIFLPRNFWRPWEDCLGKYVIANFPFSINFVTFNMRNIHMDFIEFLISFWGGPYHFVCSILLYYLAQLQYNLKEPRYAIILHYLQ